MTTMQDCSVGIGVESVFGTGVTPTRWLEFVDEGLDYQKKTVQGKGIRVGSRVARSNRRAVVSADIGGDLTLECLSKGLGLLWQACLGAGASALVSGTTYQQVFTLGDVPTFTLQKGLPRVDGTVDAYTFTGCAVDKFEIGFKNNDLLTLKASIDGRDVTTATTYAAPTYAVAANLFSFAGAAVYSGALTAPTVSALASGATQLSGVRGGSIAVSNELDADRYNAGGGGRKARQLTGERKISGSLEVEYDNAMFRDAVLSDAPLNLVVTYTAGPLSSGLETLQIVVPEIKLSGELPKSNGGDLIKQSLKFVGLDNLTAAQPLWVVVRTSDAAL